MLVLFYGMMFSLQNKWRMDFHTAPFKNQRTLLSESGGQMRICKNAVALVLLVMSAQVVASDDQRFIGIECDVKASVLRISYGGDKLGVSKGGYLIDTFNLKKNDATGEYVASVREVIKICKIKKTLYTIRISAVPGSWNLNAECGGLTFGAVKVYSEGLRLADAIFEKCCLTGDCVNSVTTRLLFINGANRPEASMASSVVN
ncbi:hypothetical protein FNU76_23495 [Chitinimonas arctica]|uniref:Uncharacterized protein n=1 Tax=Chitinimonas arctica TaxID=2594795 RepID=A0A516SLR0_9NEIS|nr:hypothetical protein [Chitinimonas arctica]QDQ29075.1 hypothetical protein FNU76_23495 [Chitinimonas arctica]